DQVIESFSIDYSEIEIDKKLAAGSYGIVYSGTWRHNSVAIKKMINLGEDSLYEFKKEVAINAQLRSDYIVAIRGYCEKPEYCLVTEYMSKGSLYQVLKDEKQILDWNIKYKIISNVASGL